MSTSEYGGIIEYDPDELAADEPMDTPLVRRVINNANHYADQAGQVVCNWVAIDSALGGIPLDILPRLDWSSAGSDSGSWWWFPLAIAWDARVRSDGSGYRLRIRMHGSVDSSLGRAADFAVVVARGDLVDLSRGPGTAGLGPTIVSDPHSAMKTVTGVTSSTMTALTFDDGTRYIDVTGAMIGAARDAGAYQSTPMDIGGAPTAIHTARMGIYVLGRVPAGGPPDHLPKLHSFYAAEVLR